MFAKLSLLCVAALSLAACSANMPKAEKGSRGPASHSWSTYHWKRTSPQFTLKLGDNLTTSTWKGHLARASQDWNSPSAVGATFTPVLTRVVAGQTTSRRCAMVKGTTQVCNGKYGNNGWLGLASISITEGDHITQGSAKMNDTYFSTAKYGNPNERQHVMCQEIAHTFGLDHQSEDGSSQDSCMDYFSNTGVNATSTLSTKPNFHDFEELAELYGHLDSGTTVSPFRTTAAARGNDVNENPRTWGRWMREKSRGRSAFYERRHRNGSVTITHVYWTEEHAAHCDDCDHRDQRH